MSDLLAKFSAKSKQWLMFLHVDKGRTETTCEKYALNLERLGDYCLEHDIDPLCIQPDKLADFTGMHMHKMGLAPATRRTVISCIRQFYEWLKKCGDIESDVTGDLVYPSKSRKVPVAMQLVNFERLLMQPDITTLTGARDAAMMAMMAGTGMRVGGLVGLNEGHLVKFHDGVNDRLAIKPKEKGGHERITPVPREAELFLLTYLGHPELAEVDRTLADGDKVLFVSTMNRRVLACNYIGERRRISARAVLNAMQRHAEDADIPLAEAHPHALRHLLGVEMTESDIPNIGIQTQLDHVSADSTAIYARLALRKNTAQLDKSNPLSKINTQVSPLLKVLETSK